MQVKIPVWSVKATLSKVSGTALMACFLRLFAWTDTFLWCWDHWWRWSACLCGDDLRKPSCTTFSKGLHQYYKSSTSTLYYYRVVPMHFALYQCILHKSVSGLLIILLEFLHTYPNFSELFLRGSEMEVLRTGTRPGVWLVQIIVLLLLSFIWKLTQLVLIWNVELPILLFTEDKHFKKSYSVYIPIYDSLTNQIRKQLTVLEHRDPIWGSG